ncbi:DUF4328 domain-containing protein [Streptomyces sp. KR55]|uniref:DUF4328 domain-containing protein n=1 Tax=Streptomyces sp. KR55 TaxID=3457425 RepID=UPI003FD52B7F
MSVFENPRPYALLPGRIPRPSRWMLITVSALLAAVALSGVFAVYAGVRLYTLIKGDFGFATAPQAQLDAAYSQYETAGKIQVCAYAPCAVMFIVWFFRMRRSTGLLAPDRFRNGPGWAIGAWFIPIANLWMPYRIALDMWGAASPLPADGESFRAPMWPVNLWWGLFVFNTLLSRYAARHFDRADTLVELRDAVMQYMVSDALEIAAAGAAVYFVVRLTAMHWRKTTEGPYLTAV